MKELSFPQMAPTDDALFSTGTGLERVGVVGLDQDYWRTELEDAGSPGLKRVRVAGSVPG